ncbi:MAG: hypothetical protein ACHP93_05435 [Solirubrobacterales bacterium]|nr:hypothetical protein [Thermoplasmata archaeon]
MIRTVADVEEARRFGVPIYLLRADRLRELGLAAEFPSHLLVGAVVEGAVESKFPRICFRYSETVSLPRIEDLIVALLRVDPLLARLLLVANQSFVDPSHLSLRVVQEDVAASATQVGFQQFASAVPVVGASIPWPVLQRHDEGHAVRGLRA